MPDISDILKLNSKLDTDKKPLLPIYQTIGEFIRLRKQNFTVDSKISQYLTPKDIFDTTAVHSNNTMAAALLGNMWPNGAKSIRIVRPDSLISTSAVDDYFKKISVKLTNAMDHPKAKLSLCLDEFENDLGAFGTCGIAVFEEASIDAPIAYKVWDVKTMLLDEDKNGTIDTIFNNFNLNVRQVVDEYGYKNVSEKVRKLYDNKKYDEQVKLLHAITPRPLAEMKKGGKTNKGMPYASYHIEVETRHLIKESGYKRVPVIVGRFYRVPGEIFGRSPGMYALSDILELNAVREAKMLATEKMLDPPLAVYDDGTLGAGQVDTSAGGMTVFNISGRLGNTKPIEPIYTVGEMQYTDKHIEQLMFNITQQFYIDRLLDLNNETRMTLGEAQIRNRIRGDSLTAIFNRRENEVLTPIIDLSLAIMMDKKLLGVREGSVEKAGKVVMGEEVITIPPEVQNLIDSGREWYKIQYISPAKRMQQAEEMQGIMTVTELLGQIAQYDPTVLDWLNRDVMARRATELSGGPNELIQSGTEVAQIRQMRAQQQEAMAQAEAAKQQSEVMRNMAQAQQMSGVGQEATLGF